MCKENVHVLVFCAAYNLHLWQYISVQPFSASEEPLQVLSIVVNVADVLCSLPVAECIVLTFWQEEDTIWSFLHRIIGSIT